MTVLTNQSKTAPLRWEFWPTSLRQISTYQLEKVTLHNRLKVSQKPSCSDWKEWLSHSCLNLKAVSKGHWPWLGSPCLDSGSYAWQIPILFQEPCSAERAKLRLDEKVWQIQTKAKGKQWFLWEMNKFRNKTFIIQAGISTQSSNQWSCNKVLKIFLKSQIQCYKGSL